MIDKMVEWTVWPNRTIRCKWSPKSGDIKHEGDSSTQPFSHFHGLLRYAKNHDHHK